MNSIKVTREQVENDYPHIYEEFIESLRTSNSLSRKINVDKTKWFYTWGSFVKKAKTAKEKVLREIETANMFDLLFDDRLNLELSKIRVTVTMEAGKFLRGDRARKMLEVPDSIVKIVTETTKLRMIIEQREFNNTDVKNSIPNIDESIIPKEQLDLILTDSESGREEAEEELDVDTILEKITSSGIESLSTKEKQFLDNLK